MFNNKTYNSPNSGLCYSVIFFSGGVEGQAASANEKWNEEAQDKMQYIGRLKRGGGGMQYRST
jgi:hypothetical protein